MLGLFERNLVEEFLQILKNGILSQVAHRIVVLILTAVQGHGLMYLNKLQQVGRFGQGTIKRFDHS